MVLKEFYYCVVSFPDFPSQCLSAILDWYLHVYILSSQAFTIPCSGSPMAQEEKVEKCLTRIDLWLVSTTSSLPTGIHIFWFSSWWYGLMFCVPIWGQPLHLCTRYSPSYLLLQHFSFLFFTVLSPSLPDHSYQLSKKCYHFYHLWNNPPLISQSLPATSQFLCSTW